MTSYYFAATKSGEALTRVTRKALGVDDSHLVNARDAYHARALRAQLAALKKAARAYLSNPSGRAKVQLEKQLTRKGV